MTIADKLLRHLHKKYIPEFIVFSAKTSANQTQDLIDGKLDKRSASFCAQLFCPGGMGGLGE